MKLDMKKCLIAAMMMLGTSAAFAGDSDALKAILKAKTFDEAQALMKSTGNSLANSEEKAKAYNKLVDLAMEKVSKEQAVMTANQMAEQMKTGKVEPYDTVGFNQAIYNAIYNAIECEKHDIAPNEKGKVKPKFHEANQNRLYSLRPNLIVAGQSISDDKKDEAIKFFTLYVDSHSSSLFKEAAAKQKDQYLGEVARVAAVLTFQNKDLESANKYVEIAMADSAAHKEALNLKIYIASQGLKEKADSVKFAQTLQELYDKDPSNDMVFGQLAATYQALGNLEASNKLLDARLATNPNDYTALAIKGQNYMNTNKHDEAIECYKKALSVKAEDALIYTYLGFCINAKAAACQNEAEMKKFYEQSAPYLEKARSLDPNRERANWCYPLYQCYYTLYGADDARTKEVEAMTK